MQPFSRSASASSVKAERAQIMEWTQSIGRLQAELDLIRASRSWRYSYPLRALSRVMRRMRD
jgi:hypothetical protein